MGYVPFHLLFGSIDSDCLSVYPSLQIELTKWPLAFTWEFGADTLLDFPMWILAVKKGFPHNHAFHGKN